MANGVEYEEVYGRGKRKRWREIRKGSIYGTSFRGIGIENTNLCIKYSEKQIFIFQSHARQGLVFLLWF
jgi:hypothetical protein